MNIRKNHDLFLLGIILMSAAVLSLLTLVLLHAITKSKSAEDSSAAGYVSDSFDDADTARAQLKPDEAPPYDLSYPYADFLDSDLSDWTEDAPSLNTGLYHSDANTLINDTQTYFFDADARFIHSAEFNNNKINFNIFYSHSTFREGLFLDGLIFNYDGITHVLDLRSLEEPLHFYSIDHYNFSYLTVNDYNFDGFMDIGIYSSRGSINNMIYEIFLYNLRTKSYDHNKELSGLINIYVDKETQTIHSHEEGAGLLHTASAVHNAVYSSFEHKWRNSVLTLVYSETQDYNSDYNLYIRTIRILQNNGRWIEETETFFAEDY